MLFQAVARILKDAHRNKVNKHLLCIYCVAWNLTEPRCRLAARGQNQMMTFPKFAFSDANASPWLQPDIYHVWLADLYSENSKCVENRMCSHLTAPRPLSLPSFSVFNCSMWTGHSPCPGHTISHQEELYFTCSYFFPTIYAGKWEGERVLKMREGNWRRKGEKMQSAEETSENKGFPLVMFIILHAPPLLAP